MLRPMDPYNTGRYITFCDVEASTDNELPHISLLVAATHQSKLELGYIHASALSYTN